MIWRSFSLEETGALWELSNGFGLARGVGRGFVFSLGAIGRSEPARESKLIRMLTSSDKLLLLWQCEMRRCYC